MLFCDYESSATKRGTRPQSYLSPDVLPEERDVHGSPARQAAQGRRAEGGDTAPHPADTDQGASAP